IETLLSFDADLLVVPEFRAHSPGAPIVRALEDADYSVTYPATDSSVNTVLLASRTKVRHSSPLTSDLPESRHLWVAELDWLSICGVYMPLSETKVPYWEAIIGAMAQGIPSLFVGDFNTGSNTLDKDPRGQPFVGAHYLERIVDHGFAD